MTPYGPPLIFLDLPLRFGGEVSINIHEIATYKGVALDDVDLPPIRVCDSALLESHGATREPGHLSCTIVTLRSGAIYDIALPVYEFRDLMLRAVVGSEAAR